MEDETLSEDYICLYVKHFFKSAGRDALSLLPGGRDAGGFFERAGCPFSEPVNPKINVALSQHDIPICEHQNSRKLEPEDLTPYSLILTMTFSEKVTVMENYQQDNVYTLGEFVGEDTDIADPYGGEEEQYEKCFEDIERRVRMVIAQFRENGGEKQ